MQPHRNKKLHSQLWNTHEKAEHKTQEKLSAAKDWQPLIWVILTAAVTALQQPHLQQELTTESGALMLAREEAGDSKGDGAAEELRSLSLSSLRGGGESALGLSAVSDNMP